MEVISCFIRENAFILGTRLEQEIIKEVQKQALQYKHCPFCGEELKRVAVEGYINYRCLKCMEDWRDNEVGKQNGS
jgi:tRNA(Ile2) C34 agmatinyltransferase TiaS